MKTSLGFKAILLCVALAAGQENYSQWSFFKDVAVNTKASGANITNNVTGFPILVRFGTSDSLIFKQAGLNGASLRFTKGSGARLKHQIDQWDTTARSGAVWVLVDTVKGNDSLTSFRLYWGKIGAADSSDGSGVFSNGFTNVWHLGNADATAPRPNAITGGNPATPFNFPGGYTARTGIVGKADTLRGGPAGTGPNGSNLINLDRLDLGTITNDHSNGFTFSIWAYPTKQGTGTAYFVGSNSTGASPNNALIVIGHNGANAGAKFRIRNSTDAGNIGILGNPGTNNEMGGTGTWRHLMFTKNPAAVSGGAMVVYMNGVQLATNNPVPSGGSATPGDIPATTRTMNWLGVSHAGLAFSDSGFTGLFDEARLANTTRSAEWAKLEFESQKLASSVVILGTTQSIATAPTALDYSSDTAVHSLSFPITPNVATVTGLVDSFTVAPALPTGLTLSKTSGTITGTPTVLTAAANYVVTATNSLGTAKDTLRLSVVSAPPAINYAASVSYLAGAMIAPLTPSVIGSVDSFTVAPALPTGLSLSKTTGAITGTPTAAAAAANFVVSATNSAGTGRDTISITIVASENYSTWGKHRSLWLNTQANGANVATNVVNFPVLVRLATTDTVYAQMLSGTADLRFTKANDVTRLPHQVEAWDSLGKTASVWVLVDTVKGNSRDHLIRMHWNKAGAQNLSSGPSVFDSARGFQAVFHFGEGTSDTAYDASTNALKGIPQRTATTYSFPEDTVGAVGRARRFGITSPATTVNSAGSYFTVANSANVLNFPQNGPFTLSTWAIVPATGTSRTLVSKSDRAYALEFRNSGADWEFTEHNQPLGNWQVVSAPAATAGLGGASTVGVWTHVMGVRNASSSWLYINGALVDTIPNTDATTTARITTNDLNIGRSPDGGTNNAARYYWRGILDEVRLANVPRSAAWAKLEYENQQATQTLVSLTQPGVVGVARSGHSASVVADRLTVKASGSGVLFQLSGAALGGKIALMDIHGRTIWSGAFPAGASQVSWNGVATSGQAVSGGVYLARVTLAKADGKVKTLEAKVPFTP